MKIDDLRMMFWMLTATDIEFFIADQIQLIFVQNLLFLFSFDHLSGEFLDLKV
jgi:hypothetical protein